jgi:hypothetical protein
MKLYKSPTGEIYAYEADGSQDHLISEDFVALTKEEIIARENAFAKLKAEAEIKEAQAIAAKDSALAKLAALGLTQDEVKALIG